MDKIKMLCVEGYGLEWSPKFEEIFDIERKGFSPGDDSSMIVLKREELVKCLADKEICIIGYDAVTEDIVKKSADVKLLLSVRDGPEENIDIDTCIAVGVSATSSTGRRVVSVAGFMLPLMLMSARPMTPVIEKIRSEGQTKQNSPSLRSVYTHQFTKLYNKSPRITGFERNAKSPSVLANTFHMQVDAYGPYASKEVMDSLHVKKMGSDQVVRTAGYAVVLIRLTPGTRGILSREFISSMKPTAPIVNTGRVRLVDGEVILGALEQQVIKFTALDMRTPEPLGALFENRIYQIPEDRLIITSRVVGVIKECSWHQYHLLYKQLLEYF